MRLDGLYRSFMAPCCWRENLATHQSPRAEELRQQIRELVQAEKSDAEVRTLMVERYTRRILSQPETEGLAGRWLGWTPIAAVLAGLMIVVLFIKHSVMRETESRAT
jgi:cytochrome c-type biogenesis protein CcmH